MSSQGMMLLLLGATFFSLKGILIKLAYHHDVETTELMTLRMLFSLPVYLSVLVVELLRHQSPSLNASRLVSVALLGLFGYYFASWLDLKGLVYLPANIGRLVLYTYPAMVILIGVVIFKKPLSWRVSLTLVLIYIGLLVVLIPPVMALPGDVFDSSFIAGVLLILLSAFCFAIYLIGSEYMMRHMSSKLFTAIAITAASLAILIHYSIHYPLGNLLEQPIEVYGYSIAIAIFCTILPSFMISAGIERVGAVNGSMVTTISPVITLVFAYFLLDERLGLLQLLGFVIVICGIYCLSQIRLLKQ